MYIFHGSEAVGLDSITREIPIILENFNTVGHLPVSKRWDWSEKMLANVLRDGWFVNTPVGNHGNAESVMDHKHHLCRMIELYYPKYMHETMKGFADVHDNPESIVHAMINDVRRDLNPRFNDKSYTISDGDKNYAENVAARMLLEGESGRIEAWGEYREKSSVASTEFNGLDKLCVMWKCVNFVENGQYDYPDFQAYWNYWPLDKVKETLPPIILQAYEQDLWPRILRLRS